MQPILMDFQVADEDVLSFELFLLSWVAFSWY